MLTVTETGALQAQVRAWRDEGDRVAFVPTMGSLHEGHLRLVDEARSQADRCIVSIFVNPTQFGPGEDFDSYPRTAEDDVALLTARHADLLFMPPVEVIYPDGGKIDETCIPPSSLTDMLCGMTRPGHFAGVATVVKRLFELVQPDVAIFGEKDYQQLQVIRWLVRAHELPVRIVGVETVREASGLAMSSRNRYLSGEEREKAAALYATLKIVCQQLASHPPADSNGFNELAMEAVQQLHFAGFEPDYVSIRAAANLGEPDTTREWIVLAAAQLGKARLIDNLRCK